MIELRTTQKTVIHPDHQLIVPVLAEKDLGTIRYSRNLSCIRKEDTTTGVPSPDTNRRHEKPRSDY